MIGFDISVPMLTSNKMFLELYRARLRLFAKFLRSRVVKRCCFDQKTWFDAKRKKFKLGVCGTSACAGGWSTVLFPELCHYGPHKKTDKVYWREVCTPSGKEGYEAMREVYGVNDFAQEEIFGLATMTPREKARQIEELLADDEAGRIKLFYPNLY